MHYRCPLASCRILFARRRRSSRVSSNGCPAGSGPPSSSGPKPGTRPDSRPRARASRIAWAAMSWRSALVVGVLAIGYPRVRYGRNLLPLAVHPVVRCERGVLQASLRNQGPEVVGKHWVPRGRLRVPFRVEQANGRSPVLRLAERLVIRVWLRSRPTLHIGVDTFHQEPPAFTREFRLWVEVVPLAVQQLERAHSRVGAHLIQLALPLIHSRVPSSASRRVP